ncbi:hypothetical protein VR45_17410, partial [Streptomyces sp. NRRL S-495]
MAAGVRRSAVPGGPCLTGLPGLGRGAPTALRTQLTRRPGLPGPRLRRPARGSGRQTPAGRAVHPAGGTRRGLVLRTVGRAPVPLALAARPRLRMPVLGGGVLRRPGRPARAGSGLGRDDRRSRRTAPGPRLPGVRLVPGRLVRVRLPGPRVDAL